MREITKLMIKEYKLMKLGYDLTCMVFFEIKSIISNPYSSNMDWIISIMI